jgi:hypothetical protein
MTIFEQIKQVLEDKEEGDPVKSSEIKKMLKTRFGTNMNSVLISDYCYNLTNDGINFEEHPHLFEWVKRNEYVYRGENYNYTREIFHKPVRQERRVVGEWINGRPVLFSTKE